MKKVFFLTLLILPFLSCTSDDENKEDPILGTWVSEGQSVTYYKSTWTFNEDFTGVFTDTETENDPDPYSEDFSWSVEDDLYTLVYEVEGTDGDDDVFKISSSLGEPVLVDLDDTTIAIKEE
ncbi:MAG: hypothetical protein ABJN84_08795 [Flavobacteriaceae bacterium]